MGVTVKRNTNVLRVTQLNPLASFALNANRLLGRYSAGHGNAQEITIGAGLCLSACGVLSNTGGGGSATWDTIGGDQADVNVGGFTNDAGYITSAALAGYALLSGAVFTGAISATNLSGTNTGDQDLSPYALISSLADVATSGAYADLTGQPTSLSDFTNDPGFITSAALSGYALLSGATFTGAISATNLSGTNTGDQDLSAYALTANVHNVPAGGNTGCVLGKSSNSDYALAWVSSGGGGGSYLNLDQTTPQTIVNGSPIFCDGAVFGGDFNTNLYNSGLDTEISPGIFVPVFSWADAILKFPNLTNNGFLKTSSSDGTVIVDTNTYLQCLAFIGLTDAPESYSGSGGCLVAVNSGATGLEFVPNSSANYWDIFQCSLTSTYYATPIDYEDGCGGFFDRSVRVINNCNPVSFELENCYYCALTKLGQVNTCQGFFETYDSHYDATSTCPIVLLNFWARQDISCVGDCPRQDGDVLTYNSMLNVWEPKAPTGGGGGSYWNVYDCGMDCTWYVTPVDCDDGGCYHDRSVRLINNSNDVCFELFNAYNCNLTNIGQEYCNGYLNFYDSKFYMTCSCPTVNVNFWSRNDCSTFGDCTRQDGDLLTYDSCSNTWRAKAGANYWEIVDCGMSGRSYVHPLPYCDGMNNWDRSVRLTSDYSQAYYEIYNAHNYRTLYIGQCDYYMECHAPMLVCNDAYDATMTCPTVNINFWARPDDSTLGDCPRQNGDVLAWCSSTNTWQPKPLGGGGGGSSSGCLDSIQLSDGSGGFIDAGLASSSGQNFFQYECNKLRLLGSEMGTYNPSLCIFNDDCVYWRFYSGDTCSNDYGLGFLFDMHSMGCPTFDVAQGCNIFSFRPYENKALICNLYGHYAEFGVQNCGAYFGHDCCSARTTYNEGGYDRIRQYLYTYDDWTNWQDCIIGYLGCCNLQFEYHNGCSNGWSEFKFSGNHVGVNFDSGCSTVPMDFSQGYCTRLSLASDGFVRTISTLDICGGLCVYGNAPAADGTYSNPTSITIQCGIITAIS